MGGEGGGWLRWCAGCSCRVGTIAASSPFEQRVSLISPLASSLLHCSLESEDCAALSAVTSVGFSLSPLSIAKASVTPASASATLDSMAEKRVLSTSRLLLLMVGFETRGPRPDRARQRDVIVTVTFA